jgi:hypothetical protein
MSEGTNLETDTKELSDLLGGIWNQVVMQVNRLLEAHSRFGFFKFKENLNPSLEDVLQGFEFIDFALSKLLESRQLEYDETRIALNSKQCILKIKELAAACDNQRQNDYDQVINDLKKQATV